MSPSRQPVWDVLLPALPAAALRGEAPEPHRHRGGVRHTQVSSRQSGLTQYSSLFPGVRSVTWPGRSSGRLTGSPWATTWTPSGATVPSVHRGGILLTVRDGNPCKNIIASSDIILHSSATPALYPAPSHYLIQYQSHIRDSFKADIRRWTSPGNGDHFN